MARTRGKKGEKEGSKGNSLKRFTDLKKRGTYSFASSGGGKKKRGRRTVFD